MKVIIGRKSHQRNGPMLAKPDYKSNLTVIKPSSVPYSLVDLYNNGIAIRDAGISCIRKVATFFAMYYEVRS
jgi:hypothetical protein